MSDTNLPPDAQADHSGPVVDPDSFLDDDEATAAEPAVPEPGAVPPPD